MICDDHAILLEAMQIALADRGHEVVGTATNPDDAVEVVAQQRPDVCLLDVNFPDGSSLPAIPRLREASPVTKVLLLSADLSPAVVVAAIESGAAGFVRKDAPLHRLVELMALAMEGHLAVEPALLQAALRSKDQRHDPLWVLSFLTEREWQVLRCIIDGYSTTEIAGVLGVQNSTARTHVQNVLTKLGVHSRLQAAALIAAHGSDDIWPAHVRNRG
ncbi:MAG: response regulator transcription factor [Dermatophilaceae bacterium]